MCTGPCLVHRSQAATNEARPRPDPEPKTATPPGPRRSYDHRGSGLRRVSQGGQCATLFILPPVIIAHMSAVTPFGQVHVLMPCFAGSV